MLKSVQKNVFSSFTTSNNVIIVIFNCKVHDHLILNQHNQSITHLWGGGGVMLQNSQVKKLDWNTGKEPEPQNKSLFNKHTPSRYLATVTSPDEQ